MRKSLLTLLTCLACTTVLFSQKTEFIRFKGDGFHDFLLRIAYLYPEFKPGKMYFKSGGSAGGMMNLNFLFNEMHFTDDKGDTLAIADVNSIARIVIGPDSFYYQDAYLEKIAGYGDSAVFIKQSLKMIEERKAGAGGLMTTTNHIGTTDRYTEFFEHTIGNNSEVVFAKQTFFYFMYSKGKFAEATKRNFNKYFPAGAGEMEKFITDNKINLNVAEDLVKLLSFLVAHK